MRTHELSKVLVTLSKILKSGPDVELDGWALNSRKKSADIGDAEIKDADIPAALYTLVKLNDVSKSQWISLINEYGIEVDIRPRDANRDIVGKILSYLASNPIARENLISSSAKKNVSESSELANALNLLLK